MSQQRADAAGIDVMHIMLFCCLWHTYQIILSIHTRSIAKNFEYTERQIQLLAIRTCPVAAENIKDNFLLKKWLFEFSRYSGYILQVRWTKAKLLTSDFFRILCTKTYSNCFIFDLSYSRNNRVAFFVTRCIICSLLIDVWCSTSTMSVLHRELFKHWFALPSTQLRLASTSARNRMIP